MGIEQACQDPPRGGVLPDSCFLPLLGASAGEKVKKKMTIGCSLGFTIKFTAILKEVFLKRFSPEVM